MPQTRGEVVIKANLGKGESKRSEGESKRSKENRIEELLAMPKIKAAKEEVKTPKGSQAWNPKCAEVLISAKPRALPCD